MYYKKHREISHEPWENTGNLILTRTWTPCGKLEKILEETRNFVGGNNQQKSSELTRLLSRKANGCTCISEPYFRLHD